MGDVATCDICTEKFSAGYHDPLMLPCGHTFCRLCLVDCQKRSDFSCLICRRPHSSVVVNMLPINFKLLSSSTETADVEYDECNIHGDDKAYWCQICQLSLCGLCLFRNHPQDHGVVKLKDVIQEKRWFLVNDLKKWEKDLRISHSKTLLKIIRNSVCLYTSAAQLSKCEKEVNETLAQIYNVLSIQGISDIEEQIENMKERIIVATLSEQESLLEEVNRAFKFSGEEFTTRKSAKDTSSACLDGPSVKQKNLPSSTDHKSIDNRAKSFLCFQKPDGSKATLHWRDGKLLLSAFSDKPAHCDLLLKMPSEVFLELSINGNFLGRVTIRPRYNSRRGQQFAAMCAGTFGISYAGSPFHNVVSKNNPGEYIAGGWYKNPKDGKLSCKALITDLEWGGSKSGKASEGVVLGVTFKDTEETGFGICTRGQKDGIFKCPIGEVVCGMEVVKAAVRQDPVTKVVVSQCGIVVPNLRFES